MPEVPDPGTLAAIPLFAGLDPDDLHRLGQLVRRTTFPAGSTIMTAEQPGEAAYVIVRGTVKVHVEQEDGSDVVLAIRGPGEVIGEMSLVDNVGRSASVVTLEETTCFWIDRVAFQSCLQTMPRLAYNLLGILARRLRLASEQNQALASQDLYGRVAQQLLVLGEMYGETRPNGDVFIRLTLKQSDLAGLAGASRARVNQVLSYYRQRQLISLDNQGHIILHDRAALAQRGS